MLAPAVRPPCEEAALRAAPATPGCAAHAKRWVLLASILGSGIAIIEATIINVALPAIQRSLDASIAQMQWVASAYTLGRRSACCDASRHQHATVHFRATGHPIVRSLAHGQDWRWCYLDERAV